MLLINYLLIISCLTSIDCCNKNIIETSKTQKNNLWDTIQRDPSIEILYKFEQQAFEHKTPIVLTDTMSLLTSAISKVSFYESWKKASKDSLISQKINIIESNSKMVSIFYSYDVLKQELEKLNIFNEIDILPVNRILESSVIYKDRKTHKMVYIDEFDKIGLVRAEREIMPQNWHIHNDSTSILGYLCQRATTRFKGRDYNAWFSPDIPIDDGPWLFYGLPGLILKVEDADISFSFKAIGLRKMEDSNEERKQIMVGSKKITYKDFVDYKKFEMNTIKYYSRFGETVYRCDDRNPITTMPIEKE